MLWHKHLDGRRIHHIRFPKDRRVPFLLLKWLYKKYQWINLIVYYPLVSVKQFYPLRLFALWDSLWNSLFRSLNDTVILRQCFNTAIISCFCFFRKKTSRHAFIVITMMSYTGTTFPVTRTIVCTGTIPFIVTFNLHSSSLLFLLFRNLSYSSPFFL